MPVNGHGFFQNGAFFLSTNHHLRRVKMKPDEQSANSQFAAGVSFQANENARFVSQNIRDIGSQFKAKMTRTANSQFGSRRGYAFEFLDAMDQQSIWEANTRSMFSVSMARTLLIFKLDPDLLVRSSKSNS